MTFIYCFRYLFSSPLSCVAPTITLSDQSSSIYSYHSPTYPLTTYLGDYTCHFCQMNIGYADLRMLGRIFVMPYLYDLNRLGLQGIAFFQRGRQLTSTTPYCQIQDILDRLCYQHLVYVSTLIRFCLILHSFTYPEMSDYLLSDNDRSLDKSIKKDQSTKADLEGKEAPTCKT